MRLADAQQTAAPNAPPPTPAPAGAPPTPAPPADVPLVYTLPRNASELDALRRTRSELSNQLTSAADRRGELAVELENADAASKPGLQARIDQLDARILRIENDIAVTGDLYARARGQFTNTSSNEGSGPMRPDMTAISVVFTIFVLMPIAVSIARGIWKRGSVQKVETQIERENADRLSRLESSIDTIAIEVERISEGQRFVTKLLNETQGKERARIEQPRG